MKYEVIETSGEWVVQSDGVELARFADQGDALNHVAARLREAPPSQNAVSVRVRYRAPD